MFVADRRGSCRSGRPCRRPDGSPCASASRPPRWRAARTRRKPTGRCGRRFERLRPPDIVAVGRDRPKSSTLSSPGNGRRCIRGQAGSDPRRLRTRRSTKFLPPSRRCGRLLSDHRRRHGEFATCALTMKYVVRGEKATFHRASARKASLARSTSTKSRPRRLLSAWQQSELRM